MAQKLISVCINAYNSENTIKETLESVLNQTYKNLQVIVVDDCSTDKTADIVEEIASRDSRVELYRLPENGNISNCNNEALARARGEYIAHLDSDDVWVSDKIEKQYAFLEEHPEYGACFTHAIYVNSKTVPYTEETVPEDAGFLLDTFIVENMSQSEFVRFFFEKFNRLCHSSMLMPAAVVKEIGWHDLTMRFLHDFDYWARVIIKYPIYIIQEPLVLYRAREGNSTALSEKEMIAHNEELARAMYNLLNDCPDSFFLEAFSDRLKLEGEHTHEETEIEKAFVLLDAFLFLRGNYALGMRKFDELFTDKNYVALAKKRFGFGIRELYELHKNPIYFDYALNASLQNRIESGLNSLKECNSYNSLLKEENKRLSEQNRQLNETVYGLLEASNAYQATIRSPLFWPVKPLFFAKRVLGIAKSFMFPKTADGRDARAKIMLYGFFGHNLGDDMFFDMLFRRYPDTLFFVLFYNEYRPFFSKYANVRFYDLERSAIKKINAMNTKDPYIHYSEKLLLKYTDGGLHIGGSIYQQIADWQTDMKLRHRRVVKGKPFFGISNNFGPYFTDDFKSFWAGEFASFGDVCFRDVYSYMLFESLNNVRYAPDLLFSFNDPTPVPKEKRVAISVINPRFRVRSFTEEQSRLYEEKIHELIKYYVNKGYAVSLLGFCALEEDKEEVEKIWLGLDNECRLRTGCFNYDGDYRVIVNEIKKSEIVIATRFHAMVLGYVLGKKVLPICYGDKVTNVINDLHLMFNPVTFDTLGEYSAEQLDKKANKIDVQRIAELRANAAAQFAALDNFIESRGGTVIR